MSMEKKSLRLAYGQALVEAGNSHPDIVVLEADLGKSTMSYLFKEAWPERYFEMGIAEQNMARRQPAWPWLGKFPSTAPLQFSHWGALTTRFVAASPFRKPMCGFAVPAVACRILAMARRTSRSKTPM